MSNMIDLDALLAEIRAQSDTVDVPLPGGRVWRFRRVKSAAEWHSLSLSGRAFADSCAKGLLPPELLAHKPGSRSVAEQVHLLSQLAVDPPLSMAQSAELADLGGAIFLALSDALAGAMLVSVGQEVEAQVDRLGEPCDETESAEPSSP